MGSVFDYGVDVGRVFVKSVYGSGGIGCVFGGGKCWVVDVEFYCGGVLVVFGVVV